MSRLYYLSVFILTILFFACKTDKIKDENTVHIRLKKDPERINPLIFPNPTSREVYINEFEENDVLRKKRTKLKTRKAWSSNYSNSDIEGFE